MSEHLELAAAILRASRRAVCLSGAGLSAESGVPTFRDARASGSAACSTPGGALWEQFDPMTLASPEGFAADPRMVIDWYNWRRGLVARAEPNAAHRALAAASRAGRIALITQNVDDLLHRAGAADVLQVHGSIARDQCNRLRCGHTEPIDLANPPGLRDCPRCGERMRPGVVWFGESLPSDVWKKAERLAAACDAMLVAGTSAAVHPAAGLIGLAKSGGASIIIVNTQPSEASRLADIELLGKAGEIVPFLLQTPVSSPADTLTA